jgi:hypothetical protein
VGHDTDPEKAMASLRKGVSVSRTICEVWREVYDEVGGSESVDKLILEGFVMGKAIHKRLCDVAGSNDPMGWAQTVNPNFEQSKKLRGLRD